MSDKVTLTDQQMYNLVEQYVQIRVDRMSHKDLIEHVTQDLTDWYSDFTLDELEDTIGIQDEGLFEELVDNVTIEITEVKWCLLSTN